MIVALAGRRIDAAGARPERFPLKNRDLVAGRLKELLRERKATALVCAGACGADLIAMEAAGQLKLRRIMVLPLKPDRFRATSVVDRPGDWGPVFDRVRREVEAAGGLIVPAGDAGDDMKAFAEANRRILAEALRLARKLDPAANPKQGVLAVVAWEGKSRGPDDVTADFKDEAKARELDVADVLTL